MGESFLPNTNKRMTGSLSRPKKSRRGQRGMAVASRPHASTRPVQAAELKYVSLAAALYACDTTGSVTALNLVAQGSDNTNRIGRQFRCRHLRMRGVFQPQSGTTSITLCRYLIVYDAQPNGALPAITTILEASNSASNYAVDYFDRYRILLDRSVAIGALNVVATTTYNGAPATAEVVVELPLDFDVRNILTTAVIGAVETGALYLVTIGSVAAASGVNLNVATQVLFSDS